MGFWGALFGKNKVRLNRRKMAGYAAVFDKIKRNAIYNEPLSAPSDAAVGSKIGGRPRVPEGFVWPRYEGTDFDGVTASRPLAFLAQLDLEELSAFDGDKLLPAEGTLYFFYEAHVMPWGFDPKDRGAARVLYAEKDAVLHTEDFPVDLEEQFRIPEQGLAFSGGTELPDYEEYRGEAGDYEEYELACERYGAPKNHSDRFKLLGYADLIQDEITRECEIVSRGYNDGGIPSEKERAAVEESSKDWILLMQFVTIAKDDFELMWGDCGNLYFSIRREDLLNRRFDGCLAILQCT